MKVKIRATENQERLAENLEKRLKTVEEQEDFLVGETDDISKLEKIPGIESFEAGEQEHEGLGGRPVEEQAYAEIENREDAVKAFLATVKGYDLRVIDTDREWDLRKLREYNPDIIQLNKTSEELGVEHSLKEREKTEKIELEMPEKEAIDQIYREFLT